MTNNTFIDTHCHLDSQQFNTDIDQVISNAKQINIKALINIGVDVDTNRSSFELAHKYTDYIFNTVGAHPANSEEITDSHLQKILEQLEEYSPVAVGEIGLDYYHSSDRKRQWKILELMIAQAKNINKPIIIHNREADDDMLSILAEHAPFKSGIIIHSYLSGPAYVDKFLEQGCHFGIGGPMTFKSGKSHREAILQIPWTHLMLETDAPWLTPHPHRGSRNEPAYVAFVAQAIAELKDSELKFVCQTTTENALKFFNLKGV
ncbi:Uncharacterized metal-dependent hydrolase YcfH [hydrothermal vent metagenome]|uniref:Uncharacterized metal-dependent hydrolase YcfH n=1 Tax=hydrothermal vent metagenome TaxID=652676 RepID=A0A3B0YVJ6_9ZZZZ